MRHELRPNRQKDCRQSGGLVPIDVRLPKTCLIRALPIPDPSDVTLSAEMPRPQMAKSVRSYIGDILLLMRTSAPPAIYLGYLLHYLTRGSIIARFAARSSALIEKARNIDFSHDWFNAHIPFWLDTMETCGALDKNIEVLEIGSWEGYSSFMILNMFESAKLTCVDTWEGADEHKGLSEVAEIERKFDENLSAYSTRLSKVKGTSLGYFNNCEKKERFDLIYVDGSHHADDVIVDAVKSFELLRNGGLIIFDDYLWRHYRRIRDNPAGAINAFLRLKKGNYRVIKVYSQLILMKVVDDSYRALRWKTKLAAVSAIGKSSP